MLAQFVAGRPLVSGSSVTHEASSQGSAVAGLNEFFRFFEEWVSG